jgi:hypothetical protein
MTSKKNEKNAQDGDEREQQGKEASRSWTTNNLTGISEEDSAEAKPGPMQ